jgi:hypothetical protein
MIGKKSVCEMFGLHPGKPRDEYDEKQLRAGTIIELEHTDIVELAECIAKHHLDEHEEYYIHLKRMEKELEVK